MSVQSAPIDLCHFSLPNRLALNQTLSDAWKEESAHQITTYGAVLDIVKPIDYYGDFSSITLLKCDTPPDSIAALQASQCTLSWCVNEYEASVENGRNITSIHCCTVAMARFLWDAVSVDVVILRACSAIHERRRRCLEVIATGVAFPWTERRKRELNARYERGSRHGTQSETH